MSDESYQTFLFNAVKSEAQKGNGYAVSAMRTTGVEKVLTPEQQTQLEDAYSKYGSKALGDAAMAHATDLAALDAYMARPDATPLEAMRRMTALNAKLRAETGFDRDLFDYKDVHGAGKTVVGAIVAQAHRNEDHQWQLENQAREHQYRLDEKAAEDKADAAQVQALWAMGSVKTGIAMGMKAKDFDLLAINDVRSGNYQNIARAFDKEGYASGDASSIVQAKIGGSLGTSYTGDMAKAYQQWQALDSISHGAAAAYYGKYSLPMQTFDTFVRGGLNKEAAYIRAFGDPTRYSVARIPQERYKEARDAIPAAIDAMDSPGAPGWLGYVPGMNLVANTANGMFGRTPLNKSSRDVVTGVLTNHVAIASANTDQSTQQIVSDQVKAMQGDGTLERYGAFAWRDPKGTRPLSQILGAQPAEADKVFTNVLDRKLKARGFPQGAGGQNYDVHRLPDDKAGKALVYVRAIPDDGSHDIDAIISSDELMAEHVKIIGAQVRGGQPPFVWDTKLKRYTINH